MKIHTKENKLELGDEDWKALGDVTGGFSGSDLANFMLDGLIQPIRDLQKASHWKQDAGTCNNSLGWLGRKYIYPNTYAACTGCKYPPPQRFEINKLERDSKLVSTING